MPHSTWLWSVVNTVSATCFIHEENTSIDSSKLFHGAEDTHRASHRALETMDLDISPMNGLLPNDWKQLTLVQWIYKCACGSTRDNTMRPMTNGWMAIDVRWCIVRLSLCALLFNYRFQACRSVKEYNRFAMGKWCKTPFQIHEKLNIFIYNSYSVRFIAVVTYHQYQTSSQLSQSCAANSNGCNNNNNTDDDDYDSQPEKHLLCGVYTIHNDIDNNNNQYMHRRCLSICWCWWHCWYCQWLDAEHQSFEQQNNNISNDNSRHSENNVVNEPST